MNKHHSKSDPRDEIISYNKLRAFIGIIGIALPVMLVIGCFIKGSGNASFQKSISHYYYSKMHIVFTGTLCVLGGFLITYQGKGKWESRLSNFAGACAFGIAACPTTIEAFINNAESKNPYVKIHEPVTKAWGNIHFIFAALLFASFVVFCLYFFQKPDEPADLNTAKFKRRKLIYKICGYVIVGSIALIFVFFQWPVSSPQFLKYSTYIFETTALWAFGTAWLVKGSRSMEKMPVVKELVKTVR